MQGASSTGEAGKGCAAAEAARRRVRRVVVCIVLVFFFDGWCWAEEDLECGVVVA